MKSRTGWLNPSTIALTMGAIGTCIGLAIVLMVESKAVSYLSTDSKACANCHVMLSSYNTWAKSSHARVAQCADCHIPQENFFRSYAAKAMDGGRHAYIFTTNTYPEVIRATDNAKNVIQANCIRCHEPLLQAKPSANANILHHDQIDRPCWSCHREVPHGTANTISSFTGTGKGHGKVAPFIKNNGS